MFTGIITGLGRILTCQPGNSERRFRILPLFPMENISDGESIAINGVCLSVEQHSGNEFMVYASSETLVRTTLGALSPGAVVNLERALELGQRLGGHMVSGHIDCVAHVRHIEKRSQSLGIDINFPDKFGPFVVPKGSVCLDGISLTINECGRNFLVVNIIPDSQKRTNIPSWRKGTRVNMETDIIGKYVNHMLKPWKPGAEATLDLDFLAKNGFL